MQQAAGKASRGSAEEAFLALERFLKASRQPALLEPGEDPIPLQPGSYSLEIRNGSPVLQCWSETRNLVRRISAILEERRGRLEVAVERFGKRAGTLALVDLDAPHNHGAARRGERLKFRELFRRFLRRQFAGWRLVELSSEQDLEHSLSPAYPRAFLKQGTRAWAAIAAPVAQPGGVLTFGLIWLDYLRGRERRGAVEGLAVFVPVGGERTTCLRIQHLNPDAAQYAVFAYSEDGHEERVDPGDYSNLDTTLLPCHRTLATSPKHLNDWVARLAAIPGVERRGRPDGSVSLSVRGLEFARAAGDVLLFGLDSRRAAHAEHLPEIEQLASELARFRRSNPIDRTNPLYLEHPESWLESQVRASIEQIDATLQPVPVYGQVPEVTGGERGVIDLLGVDRAGRLAVVEVKASEDLHLPLQALDYWLRVKYHLDRDEFSPRGYFPGIALRHQPPRMLLVAPALQFHPTNEIVLRYLSPRIEVERIGVGIEWRKEPKVMFRSTCHSPFSAR